MPTDTQSRQYESETLFEHLAEHANALVFIYFNGYFTFVNRKMCEVLGYSREELNALANAGVI